MKNISSVHIPPHDLPQWMRQARQGLDWGVLITIVISLVITWPFILQSGLPRTNASANHVFMTADYAQALREGRLYPRWSPHVSGGYGAPIPNFYPPGAPYSAALIEIFFTQNTINAVRLVFILAICAAGAMTYAFVTRYSGSGAGILAAVIYVYSPYVGLQAPQILGDLPAVLGTAFLPMLLWSIQRLLTLNLGFDFALVALATASLIITDLRYILCGIVLTVILLLLYPHRRRIPGTRRTTILAMFSGLFCASFYWMPALLEQPYIRWQDPKINLRHADLSVWEIFLPLARIDLAEIVTLPQFTIGLCGVIFALLSAGAILLYRQQSRLQAGFFFTMVTSIAFGVTILPSQTWLLGPIALCLAISSSALVSLKYSIVPKWRRLFIPVMMVIALTTSVPVWLGVRWPQNAVQPTPLDQITYEQQGYGIAVLPPGAPFPTTFAQSPGEDRFLINGYLSGNINRISDEQISARHQRSVISTSSHSDRFQVRLTQPATFTISRAYFPGWRAQLDGDRISLSSGRAGLVDVALPARTGVLSLSLMSTPLRQRAWILSWGAAIMLIVITLSRLRRTPIHYYDDLQLLSPEELRLILFVCGGFIVIIALFATPYSPYTLHATPGHKLADTFAVQSRTESGMELISYRLSDTTFRTGDALNLDLAWRTSRPLLENYRVVIHLQDPQQNVRWQETLPLHPGAYPTRRWTTNGYISDSYSLTLSPNVIPGTYQIAVEVYACLPDCTPERRLTFFDTSGRTIGQVLVLPPLITVRS